MSNPTSPTYCRPQHLDRERLRRLITHDDFSSVCFSEAVVAVVGTAAPAFKLLAITSDALLLFPLGSGGGSSCASSAAKTTTATHVGCGDIVGVHRTSSSGQPTLRGMLIHSNSELFEIVTTDQRPLIVATFEPSSRIFFYVLRAFRLAFQKRIMGAELPVAASAPSDSVSDLHDLLQELLDELSACGDCATRCRLLDELTTAASNDHELQKLCFEDESPICSAINAGLTYGLLAFLVREISFLAHTSRDDLAYELSLLHLLHGLLFGGHWVAARLPFFRLTPVETWLRMVTHIPTLAKTTRTDTWRIARDELIDVQASLLRDLQLLQHEAALLDPSNVQRDAVAQTLITDEGFHEWIARVVKRLAVLLARTPQQLVAAEQASLGGTHWSLSLWRATTVARKLLRVASMQSDRRLATMLLCRRRDYIDLYVRNPRFGRALAATSIPHLVDVAHDLVEILDMLL